MSEFEGHTPGPWFVISGHILAGSENQLDDGEALAIADIDMDMRIDFDTVGAANARLIAAAPTLLAERDEARAQRDALAEALQEIDASTPTQAFVEAARNDPAMRARPDFLLGQVGLANIGDIARAALEKFKEQQ